MHCVAHFAEETCAERPANGDLETPSQDSEKGKTKTPFYEQTFLWRTEKSSFCFTLNQETETKLLKTARGIQEESSRSISLSFLFLDFV